MARLAMLIDLTRCIGCDACTVACKQENGTPADVFFARVLNVEAGTYPNVKRVYIPVLCNHCDNPACLKACPNKAIFRRDDGIVLIDQDRCRGTGACVSACPYGNIILQSEDRWYLPDDRAYERDFVRPRLKQNVARKCTFCAQRVDRGLKPACVVACPTTARIFGDVEDAESEISRYVAEQAEATGREAFPLLPECGTEPANLYLGTMAAQDVGTLGGAAEPPIAADEPKPRAGVQGGVVALLALLFLLFSLRGVAQPAGSQALDGAEVYSSSSCAGCHGVTAMGGFGPPLAEFKEPLHKYLSLEEFRKIVRSGKGMMPATPPSELSDAEVAAIHTFAKETKLGPAQIPVAYKVSSLLTTRNVGLIFMVISVVALLLALRVLAYWVDCTGMRQLLPYVGRFGWGRAVGLVVKSLIVDGFLVASLWKKDKFRWAMHGLLIYGFFGLGFADFLMQVVNPTRETLPLTHPLKILPNLSGLLMLAGIVYVRHRYRRDEFIDNGLTLGRDFAFLNILTITLVSGFLVEILRRGGVVEYVLPMYVLHLLSVWVLLVTAPYTRFQHAFVVPVLVALTKLAAAIAESGASLQFLYEPSPGRHHKSERIAAGVMARIDPDFNGKIRLRYYP